MLYTPVWLTVPEMEGMYTAGGVGDGREGADKREDGGGGGGDLFLFLFLRTYM